MNIALLNGSPKMKESASGTLLEELNQLINKGHSIIELKLNKKEISTIDLELIKSSDILVFAFPLYVDGIPSHLLYCLKQLEDYFKKRNVTNISVYAMVNSGFYEGEQNMLALEMMKHWCTKTGLLWGQGLGIGAGGMLISTKNIPIGNGPKKNLGNALKTFSFNILNQKSGENIMITANFPRIAYKLAAEAGWRQRIKMNGLQVKDINNKK
jgi:hypothetical protein